MRLAVISDTHDHKENILKAVSIMNEKKVDALIHCGDFIAPFVKKWFDGLNNNIKKNFYGVFGNNDGERIFLQKNLGQICNLVGMELNREFDGKRIYAAHMPIQSTINALAKSGEFDVILYGHTHNITNEKYDNGVLVVNPGEACGYLTGKSTFAIIDTEKMEADIINL
ncbi:MAG: metallophosphoesterase [Promethearchaeota archaeon]